MSNHIPLCILCFLLLFTLICYCFHRRPPRLCHRSQWPSQSPVYEDQPEYFEPAEEDTAAVGPPDQDIFNFSDILIDEAQLTAVEDVKKNSSQVQTVNERFNAAKRRATENRLKPGVYDQKQRRKLVEALLRRPQCGRRVRSWRTENSDTMRGDAVPKGVSAWGLMRMGRQNPEKDLHPGALGPMSGLQGKWLAEEIVPDNAIGEES